MDSSPSTMARQTAAAASDGERQRTGRMPLSVIVVLSDDTPVIALCGALLPLERDLARSPQHHARRLV